MKKMVVLFAVFFLVNDSIAQRNGEEEGSSFFRKENLFTGGTLNLSFGNRITNLGVSPYFGYSINKYVDVAGTIGFNYVSERDYPFLGDRLRQYLYGPGAFVRLFPMNFLFGQIQYEFNLMRNKYIPLGGTGGQIEKYKYDAHSLLIGGGISNVRNFPYQNSYYYFSILWDVGNSLRSPYKDNLQRPVPIIRAGYNIALFQGRNARN